MTTDRVESVYRDIHPRLWRSLLAFTGDPEIAADAEAESFAQALGRGQHIDDVAAWVWRAAFRIAAGLLKERARSVPFDGQESGDLVLSASVIEVLDLAAGLTEQQRACVVLRHVGCFRPREIAGLLDTSAGTVRVQLHRAHTQLRRELENA